MTELRLPNICLSCHWSRWQSTAFRHLSWVCKQHHSQMSHEMIFRLVLHLSMCIFWISKIESCTETFQATSFFSFCSKQAAAATTYNTFQIAACTLHAWKVPRWRAWKQLGNGKWEGRRSVLFFGATSLIRLTDTFQIILGVNASLYAGSAKIVHHGREAACLQIGDHAAVQPQMNLRRQNRIKNKK